MTATPTDRSPSSLRVLLVEDNPYDVLLVKKTLERHNVHAEIIHVFDEESFRQQLSVGPDIILSDYSLPTLDAIRALRLRNDGFGHIPFVLVSGVVRPDIALELVRLGATDYVSKDNLCRLPRVFRRSVGRQSDASGRTPRHHLRSDAWREAIDHARAGIFDWYRADGPLHVNAGLCELMGLPVVDVIDPDTLFASLQEEDAEWVRGELEAALQGARGDLDLSFALPGEQDGRRALLRASVLKGADGQVVGVAGSVTHVAPQPGQGPSPRVDPLTGLPERRHFLQAVDRALAGAADRDARFAALVVDLERFRRINQAHGTTVGDRALKIIANRLASVLGEGQLLARVGPDEFGVLLTRDATHDAVVRIAERLRRRVAAPLSIDAFDMLVGARVGAAVACDAARTAHDLLSDAESAVHDAKRLGVGVVVSGEEQRQEQARACRMAIDLRRALDRDAAEIAVALQPIVDAENLAPVGFESLLRWRHPDLGAVSPEEVVTVAEEEDLIGELGVLILRRALDAVVEIRSASKGEPYVTVNVSPKQLNDDRLIDAVEAELAARALPPGALVLELTETLLLDINPDICGRLSHLQRLGVRLVLDDFGTGYSGLSYLERLSVDGLKIDRCFVQRLTESRTTLVTSVLAIGRGLGIPVIAEGVEDDAMLTCLQALGCQLVQGYHVARPLSVDDAVAFAVAAADRAPRTAKAPSPLAEAQP